ncbi:MAG TPA: glycoside hydrolase family 15 protein, partial [Thermoanaerobaculia bacterium]|nr:glycoside hydrolase family 15 protein [Thermoanaerobaculia bacterium]
DLLIGNGSLVVAFDSKYRLADLYFPHVGQENHAGAPSRFGVWVDGTMSWVESDDWQRTLTYLRETLVTDVNCHNEALGLRLRCYDIVDADSNFYLRKIVVRNFRDEARTVKLFFHHDLTLYGNASGDTAMFDPESRSIIHYKSKRYFLINVATETGAGVEEYACGRSGIGGSEGTWRDAEDGKLSMNAIQQGAVDSTVAVTLTIEPHGNATAFYWICAGVRYGDVRQLDANIIADTPSRVIARTASLWYTWINKGNEDLRDLPDEIIELYRRSILVIRAHCDRDGGIVAACDSDIEWGHNDHYSYVWPRDAAFVSDAVDRAGFPEVARRFLTFANDTISNSGYFLHKYTPDGSLAPSWNPWLRDGRKQLPIQEDETALVVWLLARHYDRNRDLDFVRSVYKRLVLQPIEFMIAFRDPETGLPLPSFDMWEERWGVFTFTCSAVCAAMNAAADLANLFNEQERRTRCLSIAAEIRDAMVRHLWIEDETRFARGLTVQDGSLQLDRTIDASAFATFYLGAFPAESAMVEGTMRAVRDKLWVQTEVGGLARYENDSYQRVGDAAPAEPGNPWLICTLWLAEHAIARATSVAELQSALDLVRWVRSKARPSLVLPEQIHPFTGAPLSVSPFTWSHAQVVSVVRGYLECIRELRQNALEKTARSDEEKSSGRAVDKPTSFT